MVIPKICTKKIFFCWLDQSYQMKLLLRYITNYIFDNNLLYHRLHLCMDNIMLYQALVELNEWRTTESEVSRSNPRLDSYLFVQ